MRPRGSAGKRLSFPSGFDYNIKKEYCFGLWKACEYSALRLESRALAIDMQPFAGHCTADPAGMVYPKRNRIKMELKLTSPMPDQPAVV